MQTETTDTATEPTMTRAELIAIVERRSIGASKPMRHTHIECHCPGFVHDCKDGNFEGEDNCFCPPCAALVAVERGYAPTDTSPETEGADDQPMWCQRCGRLITLRTTEDLPWGITPDGALEELVHFETGLGAARGEPNTPDTWLDFLLLVDTIADEHLPRVEAVIARST